jgi:hypothetical protein
MNRRRTPFISMMKMVIWMVVLLGMSTTGLYAQGETSADPIIAIFGTDHFRCIDNFSNTSCAPNSLSYDLGVEPASGPMANDTWFQFVAPAGTVKLRVCSPSFNAAVEVYDASLLLIHSIDNSASSGAPGKEVGCVTGLTYGATYFVRVGRSTGTGAGTFIFNIEYAAVQLLPSESPGPNGNTCYGPGDTLKRTTSCYTGVLDTRWKIVDELGNETVIASNTGPLLLATQALCTDITYIVYAQVRAIDAECGNTFWGYSEGLPMTYCDDQCPIVIQPLDGDTICSPADAVVLMDENAGHVYQLMMSTVDDSIQFITVWLNDPYWMLNSFDSFENLVFGETYHLHARTRVCLQDPIMDFCDMGIDFVYCDEPMVSLDSSDRCIWHAIGDVVHFTTTHDSPYLEYRLKLYPVDDCSHEPISLAWMSPWQSSLDFALNEGIQFPDKVYGVTIETRMIERPCIGCIGAQTTIPAKSFGWSQTSYIGIAQAGNALIGDALGCGCE